MKAIMIALSISIASILGWFYVESTAGIPAAMGQLMRTNVYEITNSSEPSYRRGSGTGVWLDKHHILTNCHVASMFGVIEFEDGKPLPIRYEGAMALSHDHKHVFKVNVLACDEANDLALLYSWWPNHDVQDVDVNWTTTRFGSAAYSAGYGMGLPLSPKTGYFGSRDQAGNKTARLAVTLAVAPGDSGSPVFDRRGDLRALLSATAATTTYSGMLVPIGSLARTIPGLSILTFLKEAGYE